MISDSAPANMQNDDMQDEDDQENTEQVRAT
jgi:hypothetical protein